METTLSSGAAHPRYPVPQMTPNEGHAAGEARGERKIFGWGLVERSVGRVSRRVDLYWSAPDLTRHFFGDPMKLSEDHDSSSQRRDPLDPDERERVLAPSWVSCPKFGEEPFALFLNSGQGLILWTAVMVVITSLTGRSYQWSRIPEARRGS